MTMLALLCFVFALSYGSLVRQTQYGPIEGTVLGDGVSNAWLGVPFGASTAGANRFNPPQPPTSWTSTLQTTSFGAACPQHCVLPTGSCASTQSEDCLNLNIFAPANASSSSSLPVMLFIEGGGFTQGSAGVVLYDGRLLAQRTDVIVVSVNYRLGILGFLINANSDGNYGMMDQRLAMMWVQKNIANFGGDPNQVTLFGQSAGGISVAYHLLAKESWGLFSKAIVQSNPLSMPMLNHDTGRLFTKKVAEAINCDTDDVECFRQCTGSCLDTILATQDKGAGLHIFHPFVIFLPTMPLVGPGGELSNNAFELLEQAETAPGVPIIFSACKNDAVMFIYLAFPSGVTEVDYVGFITDLWGAENVPRITERYPSFVSKTQRTINMAQLATDYLFVCPARYIARQLEQQGVSARTFLFDHIWSFSQKGWGPRYSFCDDVVCHGEELPFQFGSAELLYPITRNESSLQMNMMNAISNFAKNGDPNYPAPIDGSWGTAGANQTYIFKAPTSYSMTGYDNSNCDFWDNLGYEYGGNGPLNALKHIAMNQKKEQKATNVKID